MTEPAVRSIYALKVGVLGMVVAAYFLVPGLQEFVSTGMSYLRCRNFEGLRSFILAYGIWAPATSIALMAMQSMVPLVPGIAITVTNAWIFGWQAGALYSWTGALLGAAIDFGIARWYGRPVVERFVQARYLDVTDKFFKRHGVLAVFITRLTPVIPFKVVSYGAGLTALSFSEFALATGVGQTPAIVLYSIVGQHIARSIRAAVLITTALVALSVAAYYYRDAIEKLICGKKE